LQSAANNVIKAPYELIDNIFHYVRGYSRGALKNAIQTRLQTSKNSEGIRISRQNPALMTIAPLL